MLKTVTLSAALSTAYGLASTDNSSPVQKVVKLLNDMVTQLEAEKAKDLAIHDKLECWCKTNKKEKEDAVAKAKVDEENLLASIAEHSGKQGQYKSQVAIKKKQVAALEAKVSEAEELFAADMANLKESEVELVNTVTSLKMAIEVLKKNHAGLLQLTPEAVEGISSIMHFASEKSQVMYSRKYIDDKKSFLQAATGMEGKLRRSLDSSFKPVLNLKAASKFVESFLSVQGKGPAHVSQYATTSDQIWGILEHMLEDFEKDLSEEQKAIATAEQSFKKLKASTSEELTAARTAYKTAKANHASATQGLAADEELLEKTTATKNSDIEFLANLRLQCDDIENQWALRQKERSAELSAVHDAIVILTEDENREALAKGMAVSFLQAQGMSHEEALRIHASQYLESAARRAPSWSQMSYDLMAQNGKFSAGNNPPAKNLQAMAQKVKTDSFATVKEMIDKMVVDIKEQIANDVQSRDECTEDLHQNNITTKEEKYHNKQTVSLIEDLESAIAALNTTIEECTAQIKETKLGIVAASQDREAENTAFQTTVTEQRVTQQILHKALTRLEAYYKVHDQEAVHVEGEFLQQTPPKTFGTYNKHAGSLSVVNLLEKIIADAKDLEETAVKDESEAQLAYETFVKNSNAQVTNLNEQIAVASETKATKSEEKAEAEETLQTSDRSLESLAKMKDDLHTKCDFVLAQFETRAHAMKSEIESLQKAKAILDGMK